MDLTSLLSCVFLFMRKLDIKLDNVYRNTKIAKKDDNDDVPNMII